MENIPLTKEMSMCSKHPKFPYVLSHMMKLLLLLAKLHCFDIATKDKQTSFYKEKEVSCTITQRDEVRLLLGQTAHHKQASPVCKD